MDGERSILRHAVATVAYRAAKAIRGAPDGFATFRASADTRSPGEILAHIGDLFDWGTSLVNGTQAWQDSTPLEWDAEAARMFEALGRFDGRLAASAPAGCTVEQLLQGPVADALTHVGQLALLRRLAGAPIKGENYLAAGIASGQTSAAQPAAHQEFG